LVYYLGLLHHRINVHVISLVQWLWRDAGGNSYVILKELFWHSSKDTEKNHKISVHITDLYIRPKPYTAVSGHSEILFIGEYLFTDELMHVHFSVHVTDKSWIEKLLGNDCQQQMGGNKCIKENIRKEKDTEVKIWKRILHAQEGFYAYEFL
jgi:hypothetical protein